MEEAENSEIQDNLFLHAAALCRVSFSTLETTGNDKRDH
jgi:hypothetical protein